MTGRQKDAARDNVDDAVVSGFGAEWRRFDQRAMSDEERAKTFEEYFDVFPWDALPSNPVGFDAGCGTGRWALVAAPRVGHLHCVDASADALDVAKQNLGASANVSFHRCSLDAMSLADASMDFGYSLGVLHHLPEPAGGLAACVRKLKSGAPMLIYIYYAFDGRPNWYRGLWFVSDVIRRGMSRAPFPIKSLIADTIAAIIYWPLSRLARLAERFGLDSSNFPLAAYRWHSYYTMRTDALDRFGTRLEHRMTRVEIERMMMDAGLRDIAFSERVPFWCAVGYKA